MMVAIMVRSDEGVVVKFEVEGGRSRNRHRLGGGLKYFRRDGGDDDREY
jgi:hypothetical protein